MYGSVFQVSGFFHELIITGIQMNADSNHCSENRIMLLPMDLHLVQTMGVYTDPEREPPATIIREV